MRGGSSCRQAAAPLLGLSSTVPAAQRHPRHPAPRAITQWGYSSGTAVGKVSISGSGMVRPGAGLGDLSESGRERANLSVTGPWDSCPQARAFPCHTITVRHAVAAQRDLPCAVLPLHPALPAAQPRVFGCQCGFGCARTPWVLSVGVAVCRVVFQCLLCRLHSDSVIQQGAGSTEAGRVLSWGGNNRSLASPLPETKAGEAGIWRAVDHHEPSGCLLGCQGCSASEVPVAFWADVFCPRWLLQSGESRGQCSGRWAPTPSPESLGLGGLGFDLPWTLRVSLQDQMAGCFPPRSLPRYLMKAHFSFLCIIFVCKSLFKGLGCSFEEPQLFRYP